MVFTIYQTRICNHTVIYHLRTTVIYHLQTTVIYHLQTTVIYHLLTTVIYHLQTTVIYHLQTTVIYHLQTAVIYHLQSTVIYHLRTTVIYHFNMDCYPPSMYGSWSSNFFLITHDILSIVVCVHRVDFSSYCTYLCSFSRNSYPTIFTIKMIDWNGFCVILKKIYQKHFLPSLIIIKIYQYSNKI